MLKLLLPPLDPMLPPDPMPPSSVQNDGRLCALLRRNKTLVYFERVRDGSRRFKGVGSDDNKSLIVLDDTTVEALGIDTVLRRRSTSANSASSFVPFICCYGLVNKSSR